MTAFKRAEHAVVWIPAGKIAVVWTEAQRKRKKPLVKRIVKEFDTDAFGYLTVSLAGEDGIHHCIDGQARLTAFKILFGETDNVPCRILNISDKRAAARAFRKLNIVRGSVTAIDDFKIAVTAEAEPELSLSNLITSLGYEVRVDDRDGSLCSIQACMWICRASGLERVRDVLIIIRATWGHRAAGVRAALLKGYATLLAAPASVVDHERLIKKISQKYTPEFLYGAAVTNRAMMGGNLPDSVARILAAEYNRGLKSNQRI